MALNLQQLLDLDASADAKSAPKNGRKSKNVEKWNTLKEEIHRLYVLEKNTLPTTMKIIEKNHGFEASKRSWKMKMKEWGYDKNLNVQGMQILVAKAEKRAREEGKDTVFFLGEQRISVERIYNFKKRKLVKHEVVYPSAPTPINVSYRTPTPQVDLESVIVSPKPLGLLGTSETAQYTTGLQRVGCDPSQVLVQEEFASVEHIHEEEKTASPVACENEALSGLNTGIPRSGKSWTSPSRALEISPSPTLVVTDKLSTVYNGPPQMLLGCYDPVLSTLGLSPKEDERVINEASTDCSQPPCKIIAAQEAVELAYKHKRVKNLIEAETQFLLAIDLHIQLRRGDSLNCVQALADLASVYLDQNRLSDAETYFNRAIAGHEVLASNSIDQFTANRRLAEVLRRLGKFDECGSQYRKAIDGFAQINATAERVSCEQAFGTLSMQIEQYEEGTSLLVSALSGMFEIRPYQADMYKLLTSLIACHHNRQPSSQHETLKLRIKDLQKFIDNQNPKGLLGGIYTRLEISSMPEVLFKTASIAATYSEFKQTDLAESLFLATFPHVSVLRSDFYSARKVEAGLECALHYLRTENYEKISNPLEVAWLEDVDAMTTHLFYTDRNVRNSFAKTSVYASGTPPRRRYSRSNSHTNGCI